MDGFDTKKVVEKHTKHTDTSTRQVGACSLNGYSCIPTQLKAKSSKHRNISLLVFTSHFVLCFFKWANPGLFFVLLLFFSQYNFNTN